MTSTTVMKPQVMAEILLVEDDPGDIELTRIALEEAGFASPLRVVEDGAEALRYLRREGRYQLMPRPDLVLLDLNLPRKDGREVLAEIKHDVALRRIPVVVLTTSADDRDVLRAYELHANSYIVKPVDFVQFVRAIQMLDDYWLSVVRLPPR